MSANKICVPVLLVLFSAMGCAIPVAELQRYREAFTTARQSSEVVLIDFDRTLRESRAFSEAHAGNPGAAADAQVPGAVLSTDLSTYDSKPAETADREVRVRIQAWEVVASYNEVLAQLAEGRSVEEIQESAEALGRASLKFAESALGASAPGAGAVIEIAKTLVAQIERARLRNEFSEAVSNGAPLVKRIFEVFRADSDTHFKQASTLTNRRLLLTGGEIVEAITQLDRLLTGCRPPNTDEFESTADRQAALNEALSPIGKTLLGDEYPYTLASPVEAGSPRASSLQPYSSVVDTNVTRLLAQIQSLVKSYQSEIDAITFLAELLLTYKKVLAKTDAALDALLQANDEPRDLNLIVDDVLDLTFQLKRDFAALRAARIDAR